MTEGPGRIEIVSPLTARDARHRIRSVLANDGSGDRSSVLGALRARDAPRDMVGWIADPDIELVVRGPAAESYIGPIGWRAAARSRRLRGTIADRPDGGSILTGSFVGRGRGRRDVREEEEMRAWLRRLLLPAEDPAQRGR